MIVTVTLTPALDKTAIIPGFQIDKVNRIQSFRVDAGGKGINVSKVIAALGGESVATGILGGATGRAIESSLKEQGLATAFIFVPQETRTNLKILDPEKGTFTDINEPGSPIAPDVPERVFDMVKHHVGRGDVVVLAGKTPPGVSPELFAEWTSALRRKGVRVCLDADRQVLRAGVAAGPDIIKPNREELSSAVDHELATLDDVVEAAKRLSKNDIGLVAVSLGADGAVFVHGDEVIRAEGLKVPVRSTVGAGDAMMGALALGIATDTPLEEACRTAMAVSAASVMLDGTQAPTLEQVEQLKPLVRLQRL